MNRITRTFNRWRLNTPETRELVIACERMLERWAETPPDSADRNRLWRSVHRAADALAEKAGIWPL